MRYTRYEETTTMKLNKALGKATNKPNPLPTYAEPKNATITTTAKNY